MTASEAGRRLGGGVSRHRLRPLVAAALLAAVVALDARAQGQAVGSARTSDRQAQLDAVVDSAAASGFAGVILIAPLRPGADAPARYARSVGVADRATGRPHALADRWRWASVTKQVTAVLVMQEVDAGRLALDAPVARYLPDFGSPNAGTITIRALLQHTSGLPNPDATPAGSEGVPAFHRRSGAGIAHGPSSLAYCAARPDTTPGARFSYNNCDYVVLGAVLERVTRRPYASLVQERLLRPLGLRSLALAQDRMAAIDPDSPVVGYPTGDTAAPAINIATYGAAGALYGTPDDLLAFDRALAGGRLLSDSARSQLWTGTPALGYAALGAWAFPAPLRGCPSPTSLIERRGDILGVQVRNVIAPEANLAAIVFTNRGDFAFGEIWQGAGLTHDLLAAALCGAGDAPPRR